MLPGSSRLVVNEHGGFYLATEIKEAPMQISSAPPMIIGTSRERHSPKAMAPIVTATSALAFVNGATTETGSFNVPKP